MTPEFQRQLEAARASIEPRWDQERAASVRAGMKRRASVRRRRRALSGAALAVLVSATAWWLFLPRQPVVDIDVDVTPAAGRTTWHEVGTNPALRVFQLDEGSAWFTVAPGRARKVRVVAGDVEVEVVGTRFLVKRVGTGAQVLVDHGHVRVRVAGAEPVELRDGEGRTFAPLPSPPLQPLLERSVTPTPTPSVAPQATRPRLPTPEEPKAEPPPSPPAPSWKEFAHAGDFDAAWAAMQLSPPPDDEPQELLLAADVARLSRHPEGAVAPLQRVMDNHPHDARAPLAAFTLGRVLLDELGRPREAAAAFASVRTLAPNSPLSEDALAREVEALYRAGEPTKARTLAVEYQERFPTGQRLRAVRHYGGLE